MKRKPDAAWKMPFSTREIVRALIAGFVTDAWVRMLYLDTLEKVPTDFVDRRHAPAHHRRGLAGAYP